MSDKDQESHPNPPPNPSLQVVGSATPASTAPQVVAAGTQLPSGVTPEMLAQIRPVAQSFAHQLQFSVGPPQDPIVSHLTPELIGKSIEVQSKKDDHDFEIKKLELTHEKDAKKQEHDRDHLAQFLTVGVVGGVLVFIFALCCLFLYFGKSEQVDKIITAVLVFAGGFGLGRWSKSKDHSP